MDDIEWAVHMLAQGCRPGDCAYVADKLGIERPECADCGGDECEACAERVAEAIAAHLMPEGVRWPRFEDGEPVRIGDEARGMDCDEFVGAVRIDKAGWTLLDACAEYIDSGGFGEAAERPMMPAPAPFGPVRCADCKHARVTPRGLVCALHGDAGWFATEADGFCHRGERR